MTLTYIAPVGTSSPRPAPAVGSIFFDNSVGSFKIWDGVNWSNMTYNPDDMQKELVTDELTFGGTTFYTVDPKNYDWDEIYIWVRETFGPPQTGKGDFDKRWFISGGIFYFHDCKNRDWLLLKWSSE